jgi:YfiH family protein
MSRASSSPELQPELLPLFVTAAFEGVELIQCRPLLGAGVPHGWSLRTGGFGLRERGVRDRETLARALGLSRVAFMRQVHGNAVAALDALGDVCAAPPSCDAIVTDRPGLGLAVETADCVPLLLWGERSNSVAAVHAGWRGTLARVAFSAVRSLESRFGAAAGEIHAAIGPAIRLCCFEVGEEVAAAFEESGRDLDAITRPGPRGRCHLDLVADNRAQLREAGVSDSRIYDSGGCSRCESGRFYSYRREGGGVGRTMGVIGVSVSAAVK